MSNSDKIFVVAQEYENKKKINGSIFIGYASPIKSFSEGKDVLEKVAKEHYNATHNCYAIKSKSGETKYSDDGEPNGTAGIRILNSINSFELTDIIVVVTRYFGGTKLGVGPLGKAYADTSYELLSNAEILELSKFTEIKIIYHYEDTSSIHYLLNKYNCQNIKNLYESSPVIETSIEPFMLMEFEKELSEKTHGKGILESFDKDIYLNLK